MALSLGPRLLPAAMVIFFISTNGDGPILTVVGQRFHWESWTNRRQMWGSRSGAVRRVAFGEKIVSQSRLFSCTQFRARPKAFPPAGDAVGPGNQDGGTHKCVEPRPEGF